MDLSERSAVSLESVKNQSNVASTPPSASRVAFSVFLLPLLFVLMLLPARMPAQSPANGIAQSLARARQLIQAGDTTQALALLDEAFKEKESENLDLREELLFERANDYLTFAQIVSSPSQYQYYAGHARQRLLDYIDWFNRLSPANAKSLSNSRIHTVTAFLGNADIRMDDPRKLFQDYSNISSVAFLGPDAIELWKSTLYTCPNWQAVSSEARGDPRLRKRKICACTEEWRVYAATLADWAKSFNLREVVRKSKLREAQQITQIADQCE